MRDLFRATRRELAQALGDPIKATEIQMRILSEKGLLLSWYRKIYKYIAENLSAETVNVEIGSGSSRLYEHIDGLILTNTLFIDENDLVFSAYKMPFRDSSVGNIILISVLHHLGDPHAFFKEAERVLKVGGRILISDPYLSKFSYLIWKYLHPENCDIRRLGFGDKKEINPLTDANSANGTILFALDKNSFGKTYPDLFVKRFDLHTKFHYWLAGGYNFPQFLPTSFVPLIDFMEKVFAPFDRWLASFMFVVIEKRKRDCVSII